MTSIVPIMGSAKKRLETEKFRCERSLIAQQIIIIIMISAPSYFFVKTVLDMGITVFLCVIKNKTHSEFAKKNGVNILRAELTSVNSRN